VKFHAPRRFVRAALLGAALALTTVFAPRLANADVLAGGQFEIGWTGNRAFGPYANTGLGEARGTYAVPMSGYFTTALYASSTDVRTSVSDTTITIHNAHLFSSFVPPQRFVYRDVTDSLPDFRTLPFTLDAADTTIAYDLGTNMIVQENAIALQFGGIVTPGQTVVLNVPEPGTMGFVAAAGVAMLAARRRD
jgi:hypothetical protein